MAINIDSYKEASEKSESLRSEEIASITLKNGRRKTDLLEVQFEATYLGGHRAYPAKKPIGIEILVFSDKIELKKLFLQIPFSNMTNIENMDEEKISALRVVAIGLVFFPLLLVGRLWKKKKLYTVVEFNDGVDSQNMIFDFGKHIEKMQPLIYHKMLEARIRT